jgi:hypothetical protein
MLLATLRSSSSRAARDADGSASALESIDHATLDGCEQSQTVDDITLALKALHEHGSKGLIGRVTCSSSCACVRAGGHSPGAAATQ